MSDTVLIVQAILLIIAVVMGLIWAYGVTALAGRSPLGFCLACGWGALLVGVMDKLL